MSHSFIFIKSNLSLINLSLIPKLVRDIISVMGFILLHTIFNQIWGSEYLVMALLTSVHTDDFLKEINFVAYLPQLHNGTLLSLVTLVSRVLWGKPFKGHQKILFVQDQMPPWGTERIWVKTSDSTHNQECLPVSRFVQLFQSKTQQ